MRERLARVTAAVAAAAVRRTGGPDELAKVVATLQADHPPPTGADDGRFQRVVAIFGLSEPAAEILAAAVAPALDPTIGYAYDLLTGRSLLGRPTVGLALELAGLPTATADSSAHLRSAAPLRRGGLLEVSGEAGWLDRLVQVDDRVRAHLTGDDIADETVLSVAIDALPHWCETAAEITGALAARQRLVWVHGPLGTAGVAAAVAGFDDLGAGCLVVDARLAPPGRLEAALTAAIREAGLRGLGLVVAGGDAVVAGGPGTARLLVTSPIPVVAVGSTPWPSYVAGARPLTLAAPHLTRVDRAALWAHALGEPLSGPEAESVAGLPLDPESIAVTSRQAGLLSEARGVPRTGELLREAARVVVAGQAVTSLTVGQVAAGGDRTSTFADLVLPERAEADLVRLVRWAERRDELIARGTLHTKGGRSGGLAALFTGSPGTGKTLAAHVVADELGLELMQIDLSAIVDKYVGETEKNLERVFHDAESRNVVLFFDEADALFGSRSAVQDAHDRYANQEISYLLQRMEHFDGITLLATNLRGNMDRAFVRRLQFIVHFPDPDVPTRRRLWLQHLARVGELDSADPVDVDLLAQEIDLAGGDIRNIVLAAAYDAAVAGRPVGQCLLAEAAIREHLKLGRHLPSLGQPAPH